MLKPLAAYVWNQQQLHERVAKSNEPNLRRWMPNPFSLSSQGSKTMPCQSPQTRLPCGHCHLPELNSERGPKLNAV